MIHVLTAQMSGEVKAGWHSSQQLPTLMIEAHSPREAVSKLIDAIGKNGDRNGLLISRPRTLSVGVTWGGTDHADSYTSVTATWAAGALFATIA